MDIQTRHMKHRCYCIAAMCGLSLYSWQNYSMFDSITNRFFTPHYQNGLFFCLYLAWDTYFMVLSKNRHLLYRKDLVIHHIVSFILTASCINHNSLQVSHYMSIECISLMNHPLRHSPYLLRAYRTFCIVVIRTPLSLWLWYYYNPTYLYPYLESTLTHNHFLYMRVMNCIVLFFVFYDAFLLWKLYVHKPAAYAPCCAHLEQSSATRT
jgi:hypothetical protein